MDKYKFGNKLCLLREEKGLTQKEFAAILDVSDKAVSKWENGQSIPRMDTLEKIADVLGTSIEALISNDDTDIERYRIKKDIFKNKASSAKSVFFNLGVGSIVLVFVACIFDIVVYLGFNKSNLSNVIEQNIIILAFPLGLLTAYAFINTIVLGFVRELISSFQSSPKCIEAENNAKSIGSAIHKVSALLSVVPEFLAIMSFDKDVSVVEFIIIYFVLIALLSIHFFTMKYANIEIYFTENGMFEESIEYGNFYPYSAFECVETNASDYAAGITDELKLSFSINGKKYRTKITEENVNKILKYLNIKMDADVKEQKQMDKKIRILYYTFLGIGMIITVFGAVLFISNMQFGTKNVNYTEPSSEIVPLDGFTKVMEYDDKLFVFTEQNCAVDVFDKEGKFLYANQVPVDQNGSADMYIKNNHVYIFDKVYNLYRYDMQGNFLGRSTCENYDESYTVMRYDSKNNLADTKIFKEYNMFVAYFDDNSYILTGYANSDADSDDRYVLDVHNGIEKKSIVPYSEDPVDYVENAVHSESDDYYTYQGSLYSKTRGLLYKASTWNWYRHSIMCTWLTAAAGMLFGFVSSRIILAVYKKKE